MQTLLCESIFVFREGRTEAKGNGRGRTGLMKRHRRTCCQDAPAPKHLQYAAPVPGKSLAEVDGTLRGPVEDHRFEFIAPPKPLSYIM
jgi:hypothetical protein